MKPTEPTTVNEMAAKAPETHSNQEKPKTRRKRTGRKRSEFKKIPKPAWPVRGLWESAPQEERERAHKTCMAVLEYWLGKKCKASVARDLGVSPLRVWQLSQKALSGMLAGLLAQPRTRVSPAVFEARGMESPAVLKRRIAELETMLNRTEDMVRILRTAPWLSPGPEVPPKDPKGGKSRARKKPGRKRKQAKAKVDPTEHTDANRSPAPEPQAQPGGTGCEG